MKISLLTVLGLALACNALKLDDSPKAAKTVGKSLFPVQKRILSSLGSKSKYHGVSSEEKARWVPLVLKGGVWVTKTVLKHYAKNKLNERECAHLAQGLEAVSSHSGRLVKPKSIGKWVKQYFDFGKNSHTKCETKNCGSSMKCIVRGIMCLKNKAKKLVEKYWNLPCFLTRKKIEKFFRKKLPKYVFYALWSFIEDIIEKLLNC